ncbi:MAG TPA: hypothetical protein VLZ10_13275 [Thermodesulfobacteriota bacterium]|nr:hypothetical protein [Thermodesulfobacteriota bacterium]
MVVYYTQDKSFVEKVNPFHHWFTAYEKEREKTTYECRGMHR